jgi:NAD(P)-dependent dehydrogenase (short-subunit alcohol dehydrogenase family)
MSVHMGALDGRKALVTGGKRSIGRGIALALAEAGCQVGINDLEEDDDARETIRRIEAMGRKAAFYAADISDDGQVQTMMADFVADFGTIDVLANNPYWSKNRPFLELEADNWSRTMDVCVKGFFLCSQAAARVMVEHGHGGSIASIASVHAGAVWKNDCAYGVAKAAILRLTRSMAVELGRYGIRANAILPGFMDTDHEFGTPPPAPDTSEVGSCGSSPLGRPSTPEDIGRAIAFLASPAAATITGVSLPVDGGLLAW